MPTRTHVTRRWVATHHVAGGRRGPAAAAVALTLLLGGLGG